ncbi:hypothetical protein Y032_0005g2409 [Ancylostoma ceylanicum]|uniref:Uncharacterized protein n=1 Tax=Ancylostoma ceylanicum TaxID=53326 RepID=A0A016VR81_9BILA|nr:hypothetical protein Y032_0005g2409 [Ancylostoma ceylanicum]
MKYLKYRESAFKATIDTYRFYHHYLLYRRFIWSHFELAKSGDTLSFLNFPDHTIFQGGFVGCRVFKGGFVFAPTPRQGRAGACRGLVYRFDLQHDLISFHARDSHWHFEKYHWPDIF